MKGDLDLAVGALSTLILTAYKDLLPLKVRSNVSPELNDFKSPNVRRVAIMADGSRCVETWKKNVFIRSLHPTSDSGAILASLPHNFRISQLSIFTDGSSGVASDVRGLLLR